MSGCLGIAEWERESAEWRVGWGDGIGWLVGKGRRRMQELAEEKVLDTGVCRRVSKNKMDRSQYRGHICKGCCT